MQIYAFCVQSIIIVPEQLLLSMKFNGSNKCKTRKQRGKWGKKETAVKNLLGSWQQILNINISYIFATNRHPRADSGRVTSPYKLSCYYYCCCHKK